MTSYKVKMSYLTEEGKLTFKTQFIDADAITSFYIEQEEEIDDIPVKCYGIICGGEYFGIKPETHIYKYLFEKFIQPAIKS